ncbi:hypothetical protein OKA05_16810 [Luteolibacter arcticus]|uniref:Uncharacterized protein n=1 Tax=Luteolibacter arcticus TaxID=1581411 RepID=A0ABT3GL66_9BACT|nr:hypothetical protein [Luteolibacter arcticus]MCW1924230.1 hypothetical protein [Luteolibacter arcticus]
MNITYNGSQLQIDGKAVKMPSPIREAFTVRWGVIVLMDQFSGLKGPILDIQEVRNAPKGTNLFCYSPAGIVLWKAELPTGDNSEDYYYRVSSRSPLVVNSFSSYRCEIDPATGKIIRQDFFK